MLLAEATQYSDLQDWWSLKTAEAVRPAGTTWSYFVRGDGVVSDLDELKQTIIICISTRKRSDMHRPEFASNLRDYVDYPIEQARLYVVRECIAAIQLWERRPDITRIDVESRGREGRLQATVSFKVRTLEVEERVSVSYDRG